MDARLSAGTGGRGQGGPGLQPSDERAAGQRRAPGGRRARQGRGRHQRRRPDRHRVRCPGHAAYLRPDRRDGRPRRRRRHRHRCRPRHAHRRRAPLRTGGGPARRGRGAILRSIGAPGQPRRGLHGTDPRRGRVPRRQPRGDGPMTTTITAYRTDTPTGRDGFAQLLRGEWTKFRTVRGWLIATAAAAVVMVLLGLCAGAASHETIQASPTAPAVAGHPYVPIGPDGEAVSDSFYFVHQPLDGAGRITAKVSSLTARSAQPGQGSANQTSPAGATGGVQPWTKAGLIIKANTSQGSAYAA